MMVKYKRRVHNWRGPFQDADGKTDSNQETCNEKVHPASLASQLLNSGQVQGGGRHGTRRAAGRSKTKGVPQRRERSSLKRAGAVQTKNGESSAGPSAASSASGGLLGPLGLLGGALGRLLLGLGLVVRGAGRGGRGGGAGATLLGLGSLLAGLAGGRAAGAPQAAGAVLGAPTR